MKASSCRRRHVDVAAHRRSRAHDRLHGRDGARLRDADARARHRDRLPRAAARSTSIPARTRSARASSSTISPRRCSGMPVELTVTVAEVNGRAVTLRGERPRQRRSHLPRQAQPLRRRREEDRGAARRQGAEGGTRVARGRGRVAHASRASRRTATSASPGPICSRSRSSTASPPRSSRISARPTCIRAAARSA